MDIKESKEYRLAKDWEMAVNSFSFNPERFAAAIPLPGCKASSRIVEPISNSSPSTDSTMRE